MSDSRLEKFIYAICSMDVTDLPVPLSRIEKLWNCLITGETPDFEPLSRNEKYLMAMLDRYDISNLPAPMSRGEKLLYKIAVGETDLSDVPGYLSRYEELLKYLIENGGISGGDFEYVLHTFNQSLYTLYTTAEKPVKSAILKGQTLVNLVANPTHTFTQTSTINETWKQVNKYFTVGLQVGKTYIALWDMTWTNAAYAPTPAAFCFRNKDNQGLGRYSQLPSGKYYCKVTIDGSVPTPTMFRFHTSAGTAIENTLTVSNFIVLEYQEGMENWDIPYFEGMQSVKMPVLTTTGKNLICVGRGYNNSVTLNGVRISKWNGKLGYSLF